MGFKVKNKVIGNTPGKVADENLLSSTLGDNKYLKERVKILTKSKRDLKSQLSFFKEKDKDSLTEQELMFLLHFIKEANFKGGQLEHVFQITLKLQNQYRFLQEQKDNDTLI